MADPNSPPGDDWSRLVNSAGQSASVESSPSVPPPLPTGRNTEDSFSDMPVTRSWIGPESQPASQVRGADLWPSSPQAVPLSEPVLPANTQDPSKSDYYGSNATTMGVMQETGKPYSGPIVGQPDSARWGTPGWDCSSLVSGIYAQQGIKLTPYTDAAYDETYALKPEEQRAGDVVFFKYRDRSQPKTSYPHMAIYLGQDEAGQAWIADANYTEGKVVVEPMLKLPYEIRRPIALKDEP